jgi:hypothetical protein
MDLRSLCPVLSVDPVSNEPRPSAWWDARSVEEEECGDWQLTVPSVPNNQPASIFTLDPEDLAGSRVWARLGLEWIFCADSQRSALKLRAVREPLHFSSSTSYFLFILNHPELQTRSCDGVDIVNRFALYPSGLWCP